MKEIGDNSEARGNITVQWKIKDCFSTPPPPRKWINVMKVQNFIVLVHLRVSSFNPMLPQNFIFFYASWSIKLYPQRTYPRFTNILQIKSLSSPRLSFKKNNNNREIFKKITVVRFWIELWDNTIRILEFLVIFIQI